MVFPLDSLAPIMEEQELKLGLPLRLFQDATAGIKEFIGTFYWKFSSESCFDIHCIVHLFSTKSKANVPLY